MGFRGDPERISAPDQMPYSRHEVPAFAFHERFIGRMDSRRDFIKIVPPVPYDIYIFQLQPFLRIENIDSWPASESSTVRNPHFFGKVASVENIHIMPHIPQGKCHCSGMDITGLRRNQYTHQCSSHLEGRDRARPVFRQNYGNSES